MQFRTKLPLLYLFIITSLIITMSAHADDHSDKAYNSMLDGYEYPYAVENFTLNSQEQELTMAYMDVSPDADKSNGRTVLLLHGKNFSGAYWERTIASLVDDGFRVIAPDQIGFGKSSKPRNYQYSFHQLATNTKALLDELNIEQVSVTGHSMGGMLATRFTLMYPETTTGLILVNPIGLEDWKRKVPYQSIDEWYQSIRRWNPEGVKSYMTESYFDGVWKPEYDPLLEIQAGWILGNDYDMIAWTSALHYEMIFTQPVIYEFPLIEVPTLLIIGERDRTALGKNQVSNEVRATLGRYDVLGEKAASEIPNATLVEMSGIGHIPQFEAFDSYMDSFHRFLDTL